MTLEELTRMKNVDIKKVKKEDLVDIGTVTVNKELPVKERVEDYIRQINNPYCYVDHGIIVKISFTGEKSLEDTLKSAVFSDSQNP